MLKAPPPPPPPYRLSVNTPEIDHSLFLAVAVNRVTLLTVISKCEDTKPTANALHFHHQNNSVYICEHQRGKVDLEMCKNQNLKKQKIFPFSALYGYSINICATETLWFFLPPVSNFSSLGTAILAPSLSVKSRKMAPDKIHTAIHVKFIWLLLR